MKSASCSSELSFFLDVVAALGISWELGVPRSEVVLSGLVPVSIFTMGSLEIFWLSSETKILTSNQVNKVTL